MTLEPATHTQTVHRHKTDAYRQSSSIRQHLQEGMCRRIHRWHHWGNTRLHHITLLTPIGNGSCKVGTAAVAQSCAVDKCVNDQLATTVILENLGLST